MQPGLNLQELAREIVNQARSKTDLLADNSDIASTHIEGQHVIQVGDHRLKPNTVFNSQLATKLRIPKPYFDRMAEEAPYLLDKNVNQWLHGGELKDKRRMVRTLDVTARAYLGAGYRCLDNADLAEAVLPKVANLQLQVKSSQITERRMYIQAVTPRLRGEVKVGDEVQSGIVISNSEVGEGSLSIEHLLWRLVCLNGMVTGNVIRKTHVGRGSRKQGGIELPVEEYMRDETRQLDDAAFFSKVCDAMDYALSPELFQASLEKARGAAETKIAKPKEAVEVVTKQLQLTQGEGEGLLANLIEGGDLSRWGMANAVTALAHKSEDYDRAVALERAGTTVIDMQPKQWEGTLSV